MTQSQSRRHFLRFAGAGTAFVWVPRLVKGYSGAEMQARVVDDRIEPGISKWDLDTPCLCVDLDGLEGNIEQMHTTVTRNGIASRPCGSHHGNIPAGRHSYRPGNQAGGPGRG